MTSTVRILTTATPDSSPSVLLRSPNGSLTLLDCPEGCQRSFLETLEAKVRNVDRICVSRVGWEGTGGLPGFLLTSADSLGSSSSVEVDGGKQDGGGGGKRKDGGSRNVGRDRSGGSGGSGETGGRGGGGRGSGGGRGGGNHSPVLNGGKKNTSGKRSFHATTNNTKTTIEGGIHIVGPKGTQTFIDSLRHFMRRDKFVVKVDEGTYVSNTNQNKNAVVGRSNSKKRKRIGGGGGSSNGDGGSDGMFHVTTIPLVQTVHVLPPPLSASHVASSPVTAPSSPPPPPPPPTTTTTITTPTVTTAERNLTSFLFVSDPIPGKFQLHKAKELGIPPGPMYADLVRGNTVTFQRRSSSNKEGEGENEEVMVRPEQVLEGGSDGVAVLYVFCPDGGVLEQLCWGSGAGAVLERFRVGSNKEMMKEGEEKMEGVSSQTEQQPQSQPKPKQERGKGGATSNVRLEVILHCTPTYLLNNPRYRAWMEGFGTEVTHVHLPPTVEPRNHHHSDNNNNDDDDGNSVVDRIKELRSPFCSAMTGAIGRSLLHPGIYIDPSLSSCGRRSFASVAKSTTTTIAVDPIPAVAFTNGDEPTPTSSSISTPVLNVVRARRGMEYVLLPLSKKGLAKVPYTTSNEKSDGILNDHGTPLTDGDSEHDNPIVHRAHESGAFRAAREIIDSWIKDGGEDGGDVGGAGAGAGTGDEEEVKTVTTQGNNTLRTISDETTTSITKRLTTTNIEMTNTGAELVFTGTGSAVPCKHRNVSGIYLRTAIAVTNDGVMKRDAMLLDVGEGTVGQLRRVWSSSLSCDDCRLVEEEMDEENTKQRLRNIAAVFVSHPHADHHLGIVRFLTERNAALLGTMTARSKDVSRRKSVASSSSRSAVTVSDVVEGDQRILLIAPRGVLNFLSDYRNVDPTIRNGYVPVDCETLTTGWDDCDAERRSTKTMSAAEIAARERLRTDLGISYIATVPVVHCRNSYGLVMDTGDGVDDGGSCSSFGRVVYSGDCRPSSRLVDVARRQRRQLRRGTTNDGAGGGGGGGENGEEIVDLLIHEATFEDGMESEALIKRHSTVGEALSVGRDMGAKTVVLTHFSQRYPKIPPSFDKDVSNLKVQRVPTVAAPKTTSATIVVAFDYMRIEPGTLRLASRLTPALRLLYPADEATASGAGELGTTDNRNGEGSNRVRAEKEKENKEKTAEDILSVPGAFAVPFRCN